jgi:DNA-binding SARP family transcriptional activator
VGDLRFTVLGPVRAWRDGEELDLGPPTQRAILALLLARAGQPVSVSELVDLVWGEDPPLSAVNIVHRHIGMLRRLFEPGLPTRTAGRWLRVSGGGYLLEADPAAVDLLRFRQLIAQARDAIAGGRPEDAVRTLVAALDLWQGQAATGVEQPARDHPVFTALDREHLAAVREAVDVAMGADLADRVLAPARLAASAHALDESMQARLILVLAAAGHQAEALDTYHAVRIRLADELGIDPGPEVRAAHERVLRQQVTPAPGPDPATPPAQLPAALSTFTGRGREMAEMLALLVDPRQPQPTVVISAISGMAGIGKTTLAVHWAHQVAHRFPDGQLYVNLRGFDPTGAVTSPAEAVRGFLDALGVTPERIPAGIDAQAALYRSLLSGRKVLVLLDNARDVDQVRPLLPGSPGCLVIVTSRDRLAGLVAADGAHRLSLDLFPAHAARDFLARRLGADRLAADQPAADEIVGWCAGLPLALAIVAARATAQAQFPLAAIAAELRAAHGSLDAFAGTGAAIDARAVFSWSYRTLTADAARLFRLLSLHPGPATGAAAAASLTGCPIRRARSLLAELTGAHLIIEQTPGRYAFHDLLRAYAAELTETDDSPDTRRAAVHRLLDHYVHTGYRAARQLATLPEPVTLAAPEPEVVLDDVADHPRALAWFTTEHAALLGAVGLAAQTGFDAHTWHLAWVSRLYFAMRGHWHDWVGTQLAARDAARRLRDPSALGHSHVYLAAAYRRLGRSADAHTEFGHALALFREIGDPAGQADALRGLAGTLEELGRSREALRHAEEALELTRDRGDPIGLGFALNDIGWTCAMIGEYRQGLTYCLEALRLLQQEGHHRGESATLDSLGYIYRHLGDYPEAVGCYRRAAELSREVGDRYPEAETLAGLGDVYHDAGDDEAADAAWRQALAILDELGHPDAGSVRDKLTRRPASR